MNLLGALDKNLRESMQYEIKHIHESIGVTVVYVTHDQTEALTMSNRIAVFNDGKFNNFQVLMNYMKDQLILLLQNLLERIILLQGSIRCVR